jgi:hypothetical protein
MLPTIRAALAVDAFKSNEPKLEEAMTKKLFVAVADVLYGAKTNLSLPEFHIVNDIAERLADLFAAGNPHFDRERFLAACSGVATGRT